MKAKLGNLKNLFKQMADNVGNILKLLEHDKGQDSPLMVENQGPIKLSRAHSKKNEEVSKMDEVKAVAENMHILADQAIDLIKIS